MGGSMARRLARRKLRELAKHIQDNEEANTVAELLQRLGRKDLIIMKYEQALDEARMAMVYYNKVVLAARDVITLWKEDTLDEDVAIAIANLEQAFKEFDEFFGTEDDHGEGNPDEDREGEGQETPSVREAGSDSTKAEDGGQ